MIFSSVTDNNILIIANYIHVCVSCGKGVAEIPILMPWNITAGKLTRVRPYQILYSVLTQMSSHGHRLFRILYTAVLCPLPNAFANDTHERIRFPFFCSATQMRSPVIHLLGLEDHEHTALCCTAPPTSARKAASAQQCVHAPSVLWPIPRQPSPNPAWAYVW